MRDMIPGVDKESYHLVLLCENMKGYENLCLLVSEAYMNGFYYKPRVDLELLRKHHEGLIATSACLAGGVAQRLMDEDYEAALDKTIKRLVEICPESKIIIATPTEYCLPMLECQPVVDLEATELLSRRGEIAKKIAAKYDLTVNDMMQVSKANRYLHSDDGVHFTDEGYEVLAKSVAAAIKNV
jgi:DNA polymerase III alpha subunit